MDGYTRALVVILATMLAISLVLGIIVLVKAIQILNKIKAITGKAEAVADKAENVSRFFQKTAAPVAVVKLLANMYETIKKRRGGRNEDKDE